MKPIQLGLLVVVGAMGGALVMKMTERPKAAKEVVQSQPAAPVAAPVQPVQPPPAPPAEAEPAAATAPQKASPVAVPARRLASKPVRVAHVPGPAPEAKNHPAPPGPHPAAG